jgi:hypothetical protein
LTPPIADSVVQWLHKQAELRLHHFHPDLREGLASGTAAVGALFVIQIDRPRGLLVAGKADDLVDGELLADRVEERVPNAAALQRDGVLQAVERELERIPR